MSDTSNETNDRLIKMRELTAMLGQSSRTVERQIAAGLLPAKIRIGNGVFYSHAETQAYISHMATIEHTHEASYAQWLNSWGLSFKDYSALCAERPNYYAYTEWLDDNESTYSHYKESVLDTAA